MIATPNLSRQPSWKRGLLIAGGAHAVALGSLFVHLSPEEPSSRELPAIAIEMAMPAAPPTPIRDAPTPRQFEEPEPVRKQPVLKKLLFDPPPPLEVADVKPEVVLPLKKEEAPATEKSHPLPPAPTTTEQSAPDLKPDTKSTAMAIGGVSAEAASAADRWDARVLARIEMTKRYPYLAVQNNQQDEVEVVLTIDRKGQLRDAQLRANRGFAALNEAALDAVHRAAPFQEPPKEVEGDPIRIAVIVRFFK